jgi:hypothetical protein
LSGIETFMVSWGHIQDYGPSFGKLCQLPSHGLRQTAGSDRLPASGLNSNQRLKQSSTCSMK